MIPDRVTKSIKFRPCRLNLLMRIWRVEFGAGISLFDALKLAVVESLLPSKTSQPSPPLWYCLSIHEQSYINVTSYYYLGLYSWKSGLANMFFWMNEMFNSESINIYITRTTESRAAIVRISAQDTVLGHAFSSSLFISSITSNPLAEFLFGPDPFSLTMLPLSSSSIDWSHPCHTKYTFYCEEIFLRTICITIKKTLSPVNSTKYYQWDQSPLQKNTITWTKQSWKWSLSKDAAIRASFITAFCTTDPIICSALGHDSA